MEIHHLPSLTHKSSLKCACVYVEILQRQQHHMHVKMPTSVPSYFFTVNDGTAPLALPGPMSSHTAPLFSVCDDVSAECTIAQSGSPQTVEA